MFNSGPTYGVRRETLTPSEQVVYFEILKNRVMRLGDVVPFTRNYQSARSILMRLARKGYVLTVRGGIYAAVPLEYVRSDYEPDRYVLAFRLAGNSGALAFHTALELHGVAHSYYNEVFLINKGIRNLEFQGVSYRFVRSARIFGVEHIVHEGIKICITDRERTFLDCLRKPDYCGGMEEFMKSIAGFHTIDTGILRDYLEKFGEQSLWQRAGFVLTLLEKDLRVPEEFLSVMRKRVGRRAYYLTHRLTPGTGKLDKNWNVIVPIKIDEVMRFA